MSTFLFEVSLDPICDNLSDFLYICKFQKKNINHKKY